MSPDRLQEFSRKQLEGIARQNGVPNARQLRKQELIDALATSPNRRTSRRGSLAEDARLSPRSSSRQRTASSVSRQRGASTAPQQSPPSDQLSIDRVDSHWLRVGWQISRATLDRAVAALGIHWHSSNLVLQLIDVTRDDGDSPVHEIVETVLPTGAGWWYQHVPAEARLYRLAIGYRSPTGRFHLLIRSRPLSPSRLPQRGLSAHQNGATQDRTFPENSARVSSGGSKMHGEQRPLPPRDDHAALMRIPVSTDIESLPPLGVEVELLIHGATDPQAAVTLMSCPLALAEDGTFAYRLPLEAGRQVVPIVSAAADGSGERTVVIALELSTRELEPRVFDE